METSLSLHRDPGGTHLLATSKDGCRRAQEMECFSQWELCREHKGGRAPLGTLMDMYRKALERAVFLHRGHVGGHGRDAPLLGL